MPVKNGRIKSKLFLPIFNSFFSRSCIANKEGGQFDNWKREDGSVTKWCKNLVTNEETFDNSLKVSLIEKI